MNEKGEKVGQDYDQVGDPQDIGGRIAFAAQKDGKWFVVNEKGEKVSEECDKIYHFQPMEGNEAYIITKEGDNYVKRIVRV